MTTRCGTPQYAAPEVLKGLPYNVNCDLWGIGCVCITMMIADIPFPFAKDNEILKAIFDNSLELCYEQKKFAKAPPELRELIQSLCRTKPAERPSGKFILNDNIWLTK